MTNLLEKMLHSPQLPRYAEQIEQHLAEERQRRKEFYENLKGHEKVEFINGEVLYQSPIRKRHGQASDNLMLLMKVYVDKNNLGYTGHEKYLVTLSRNDYEPDIAFWGNDKAGQFTEEQMHFPAPDLVVEVLSKGTEKRDWGVKFIDYSLHGVREYWLVVTNFRMVEQYFLVNEKFELYGRFRNDDLITSRVIPGFCIPTFAIFDKTENLKALQNLLN